MIGSASSTGAAGGGGWTETAPEAAQEAARRAARAEDMTHENIRSDCRGGRSNKSGYL